MNFESIHNVYFLGIGGIGMSALASYFRAIGKNVAGYDLCPSAITDKLVSKGIEIHFEENISKIPDKFLDQSNTLVVRTPAVPDDHVELIYFISKKFRIMKRAEVLGLLFNVKKGIAIAGTHGKTSVSSMAAFILHNSSMGCSAFLGGIVKNISSNLIIDKQSNWIIAEADEFDRSFLHLKPEIALVTWVDSDHLDIYSSHEDIKQTFEKFLHRVNKEGTIILKEGIELKYDKELVKTFTYSLDSELSDFYAKNISYVNGRYTFDIRTPQGDIGEITLPYPGMTNVENAVAAASVAFVAGVSFSDISQSLSCFEGVQRRFDLRYSDSRCVYIDDYAHHPRELDAIISSVRKLYPDRKLTGVFQPHLYSRTRDFADEFAVSLSALDELILLDIYPAREKPLEGISSQMILDKVCIRQKTLCNKNKLTELLSSKEIDILLTMGAGDIDRFIDEIKQMLASR